MLHLSRQINTLRQRMEDENLERRSIIWKSPDFPHLDETELRNITCGVYQLTNLVPATCRNIQRSILRFLSIKKMIRVPYRVATHHPGHICYGSSTAQWKLPHGNANVEQEHELLENALTSRLSCGTLEAWICKAQTAYILRSQELEGTLRRCQSCD